MKNWADEGFGSAMALIAAALSEKKASCEVLGKSFIRSEAMEAPLARAAISASNTSACPPRPILACSISFPRR